MNKPAKKPRRLLHGVLLLDKDAGISSNDALGRAKWLLAASKAGHTGTLDPFATGLLPLCFGEATKFSQDLLDADKTYETVVHLGVATTTGDTEGETLPCPALPDLNSAQIEAALAQFRGPISQVPPMYSALKRDGKPLYEYARAGIELEREARAVTIHELSLLEWQAPFLRLRVCCSKGTYIRVLGEDIGRALGTGAHLQALRRVQVGDLTLAGAYTVAQIEALAEDARAALLAPLDALLSTFPAVQLPPDMAQRFGHGQRLALGRDCALPPGRVRVYAHEGAQLVCAPPTAGARLLGTAQFAMHGVLAPERLVVM
ncbi:tRNA pseudouridine(55) synthase TruB [Massilia sp. W12]|uniref:tRNA pseudouridine(55) synthase TruB n=1 Tax=Massilia sp. W12 TaxID=3126507 RepID=UPI0030D12F7F